MKLNAKRSANYAAKSDQRSDLVRLPAIAEHQKSRIQSKQQQQQKKKTKDEEHSKEQQTTSLVAWNRHGRKKPFRLTELHLDDRIVEKLRNEIYLRLDRRFHASSDDVTGSSDGSSASDDVDGYLRMLKSNDDAFFSAYNDVGLRFGSQRLTAGSGSRGRRMASLNFRGSAGSSRFVPPFYLSLPGLPEESERMGLNSALESSRPGSAVEEARARLTASSQSLAERNEDTDISVSPVASPIDCGVEEEKELCRTEVEWRRKVLEGDFSVPELHRSATVGFYVHATSETEYERTVLMERVYPRLREYGNRRGIDLEIVDPWWGMEESGLEEHVEQRLLRRTISRCHDSAKMLGRHPYFVTFLTGRNDSPASGVLPSEIPRPEFESIVEEMTEELTRLRTASLAPQEKTSKARPVSQSPEGLQEDEDDPVEPSEEPLPDEMEDVDLEDVVEEEKRKPMTVEVFQERIQTMLAWYQLDLNETPPVYRLLAPSVLFPDVLSRNGRIRTQARKSWSFVGQTLLQTIQDIASKALADDQEALQKYFTTSCQLELDHFLNLLRLDEEQTSFESCLWFRPEVKDHPDPDPIIDEVVDDLDATHGPQRIDDQDIEGLRDDPLTRKLDEPVSRKIIHAYNLPPVGDDIIDARATRTQLPPYVEQLTGAFEDVVRDVIDRAAETLPADDQSRLEREIAAHMSGCRKRVRNFVGRRLELTAIKSYVRGKSNRPFVVSGKTGSGVTSLISKAAIEAKNWIKSRSSTVVRLVGETLESQTILSLLHSLCLQLNYLQSLSSNKEPDHLELVPREWTALFNYFRDRLESLSKNQTIVLFIDSLHEIQAPNDGDRILWLQTALPSNVRIVVSTTGEETNSTLRLLRNWIQVDRTTTDSNFLELEEFSRSDVASVTHDWSSNRHNRSVTETQQRALEAALDACPSPLYVQLVLEEASLWTSSTEVKLGPTVRSVVLTMIARLEREYGDLLVRRALGYLALARYGLTRNELDDLLCLDELVYDEVHALLRPPLRRLPPLILLRFLAEVQELVKDCYADGYPMLCFAHVLYREIVEERYAKDGKARRAYHKVMAEYFSDQGTSDGKGSGRGDGKGDGKVAAKPVITAQPLYWDDEAEDVEASARHPRRTYNTRRLDELPHHLMLGQQTDRLKEFCFCNLDYLLARIENSSLGLRQLLEDLEVAVSVEPEDVELRLVTDVIRTSVPVLDEDPRQLGAQLAGRLLQILASDKPVTEREPDRYASLKAMLRRARDSSTYSGLIGLIPSVACLVPPTGVSYQTLSAHRGPITALATSSDGLRAVTSSKDNTLRSWDLVTGWALGKINGVGRDVYEIRLASGDTIAVTSEPRLLRVWDLKSSEFLRTMRGFDDPAALTVASGGTLLAAVSQGSNYLRVWSLEGRFELIRDTVIEETWKPVHKDCTTLLSKRCAGATIVYASRDSSVATAYDLREGKVLRRMRIEEPGSITAVVVSRAYCLCAARYPETKQLNRICLEVFDLETGKHLRTIRSCGWDTIRNLSVNAIGSHAVAFCGNRSTGKSYVATWNIETQAHKHVARHGGAPVLGAVGDLRYVLTATVDRSEVRVWNLRDTIEAKAAKERSRSGVSRILAMPDHPQYVLAQSTDGRRVDVWNVAMHDFCGSVVHSEPELTSRAEDALLLHNTTVVILSKKEYVRMDEAAEEEEDAKEEVENEKEEEKEEEEEEEEKEEKEVEKEEVLVYRTMKAYDLRQRRWISSADGLTIPVFPVDDYVLLNDDHLLGPSDSRSQFLVWEVSTGNILFQIKIPFREREPTADTSDDRPKSSSSTLQRPEAGRSASSAKMTPWARRSETRTARGRRHDAETEGRRRQRQEIQSERHNGVDRFLVSADRSTIVASFNGHHLCVFDVDSHRQARVLRSTSCLMRLAASDVTRDGRYLVDVTYDDDAKEELVCLWDLRSGLVTHRLGRRDGCWINAIAVSDDARRVVFCSQAKSSERNRMCIWTPKVLLGPSDVLEIPGHPRFNTGVDAEIRLTRDSSRAVVCAGDVSVWDLDRAELLCVFTPDSRVQCFEVALNGQLAIVGLHDVASIVTLKMVSSRSQDAVRVPAGPCLFGEDPTEVMENGVGDFYEDLSEQKIRINPALFFQSSDDA